MTAVHQETVPNFEHEAQDADRSSLESSGETTKELFRREFEADAKEETPFTESPKTPTMKSKPIKSAVGKKESATKKASNSGIPLRCKPAPVKTVHKTGTGTYRHTAPTQMGPLINKNTLEVQFLNNRKRLLQLHAELSDKQRPLLEMHKSLVRTKKQLEEMGKKVTLEDLKIVSLKDDIRSQMIDGAGENPAAEAATTLKSSIENALEACAQVCQKCFVQRDHVVDMLESASKSAIEPSNIETEVEELKRIKVELEKKVEDTMKESEKKIDEIIHNWQRAVKMKNISNEAALRIADLEETIKQQTKMIQDGEDTVVGLNRRLDEKKAIFERTVSEMQEKYNKLEEELKKEKKNANENLMKSRNLRGKAAELETKNKESEEKYNDINNKLKQMQDQLRRKEIQWVKEREDFKKNETLLQQKYAEKQSQFDTRLKEVEQLQKAAELQQQSVSRNLESQLDLKDQEYQDLQKRSENIAESNTKLEERIKKLEKELQWKEKEIAELNSKIDTLQTVEFKPSESDWLELVDYKQKVIDFESTIDQQKEQINKMQNSLKTHAKLAAALKLEKDKALEYSSKLREVLQEARDEIQCKTKIIYKIHEKLVLKEKEIEKMKEQLKEFEGSEYANEKWKNRCQICMSAMNDKADADMEAGKSHISAPQYVSESLIGMSVKKVDHLRARLDNLKRMKLPVKNKQLNVKYSLPQQLGPSEAQPISNHLRKQIELRGKLYQILQKHADQSCEDFINLLKLTVSTSGNKGALDELKPSNMKEIDEALKNFPRQMSNIKIRESFSTSVSECLGNLPFDELELEDSPNSDGEELNY